MATRRSQIVALTVAVTAAAALCNGPAPIAGQMSSTCTSVLVSLSPCLNYITGNSSKPTPICCSQLGSVVKSQPRCLCEALRRGDSGGAATGLNINRTQALELPGACNVQTPPVSSCNSGASSPSGSPWMTPSSSSSGGGVSTGSNKSVPSPRVDSSSEDRRRRYTTTIQFVALLLALVFTVWDMLF